MISNVVTYTGTRHTVIGFTYTLPGMFPANVTLTYTPPDGRIRRAIITVSNYWTAIYQIPWFIVPFRITGYEATRMWSLDTEAEDANILLQMRDDLYILYMDAVSARDRFSDSFCRAIISLEDMQDGRWTLELLETNTANVFNVHVDNADVWTGAGGALNAFVGARRTISPRINGLWELYKLSCGIRDVIAESLSMDPVNAWELPL